MATKPLSEKEMEILAFSWQCFKGGAPEIDYEKLCPMVGHSNPRSTANAMAVIKKKLATMTSGSANGTSDATTTGQKSPGKKSASATNEGRKRKPAVKAEGGATVKTEDGEDSDHASEGASPTKKKKGPTTNGTPAKKSGAVGKKVKKEDPNVDNAEDKDAEMDDEAV